MDGMVTVSNIIKMIATLSDKEKDELKLALTNGANITMSLNTLATESRFANGRVCPLCGSVHVVRNGHQADGAQRYMCRDCKKSFTATTNSVVAGTRKDMSVWERYICCMMLGLSIRKSAEACGIHRNTAFYWRHKVLDAVRKSFENMRLGGIVEMDEAFLPVSYKGNHKNSKSFKMPREPHMRGGQSTKHLDNYLAWSAFVNYMRGNDDFKRDDLLSAVVTMPVSSKCRAFSSRNPLPA